ncbi:MAG: hypothetical protein JNJ46_19185 [Myxococcales bacterium]|nr:hypothetical protein [Myxococcales bacterium]
MARQFPIGDTLYAFTQKAEPEHDISCILSSHGLKRLVKGKKFKIPAGVSLYFYGPDNFFLIDPGFEQMLLGDCMPIEVLTAGESCPNYDLTKYQGYHSSGAGASPIWPLAKIKKAFTGEPEEPPDMETYAAILNALGAADKALAQAEARYADYKEEKAKTKALPDGALKDEILTSLKRLKVDIKNDIAKARKNVDKALPDMVTVRNRITKSVTLADAVTLLAAEGYKEIHCSFCRGSAIDGLAEMVGANRSVSAKKQA